MKKRILLLITIFYFACSFSQNTTLFVQEVLEKQLNDYFKIKKIQNKLGHIPLDSIIKINTAFKKAQYVPGQIYTLNIIGVMLRDRSNYKEAIVNLKEALNLAKSINNPELKSIIFSSLGSVYRRQNDIKNALFSYQYAVSEASKIKNPSINNKKTISIAQSGIGSIYLILKQYNLALEEFTKAVKIQEEANDTQELASNYHNIGYTNEKLGNIEIASENYINSLYYHLVNNSNIGQIICKNSVCGLLIKQKKYKKALQIAKDNYKKTKNLEDKYVYSKTISLLGLAYLKNNAKKKAKLFLEESIVLAKKYNYTEDLIASSFYLSDLYAELGQPRRALHYYKKAVETDKKKSEEQNILYINNLISKQNAKIKRSQLETLKKETEIKNYEVSRNRNILIITLVSLGLLSVVLYSIYRQQLLNNERHILLLEQQALQTQMNPHFIFNALNSIKLYIVSNDTKKAAYYLNKFSKLIRNILDVSKVKEVSLEDELHTMNLYMSIENIRFDNKIEYIREIDPSLNISSIKVPPLVLQPFIENSIWHGLSSKTGNKKITITATQTVHNFIELTVSDNGVGREASTIIKKHKSLTKKSVGIQLTINRLKIFFEDFEDEFSITYHDLKDDNGNPKGTKVVLKFPLI